MVRRTHVRTEVRDEAKLYLHQLLSKNALVYLLINSNPILLRFFHSFPHLFCSSVIIETLMNIINILSFSLNEDNLHKVTAHHFVPETDYTIQFVDTHEKRVVCIFYSGGKIVFFE
jgi:hypothetical protein